MKYPSTPTPAPTPSDPYNPTPTPAPTPSYPTIDPIPFDPTKDGAISPSSFLQNKININGYYMWQGNWVGSTYNYSPFAQYFFTQVTGQQTPDRGPNNNLVPGGGFHIYTTLPIENNINLIVLFAGYSNCASALNNYKIYNGGNSAVAPSSISINGAVIEINDALLDNNNGSIDMYQSCLNYFNYYSVNNYLIGLCFGGGNANGAWGQGSSGGIYSIYQAVTLPGVGFSYNEYNASSASISGQQSGAGTGILLYGNTSSNKFNCLVFDIEDGIGSSSSGIDFINLFDYIKNNPNSTFYNSDVIIVVSMSHSCSQMIGGDVCRQIYQGYNGSEYIGVYDYVSPQLYTQNMGSTNEYCANYQIVWSDFINYMNMNPMFQAYGLTMILPSINFNSLTNTGGTNDGNAPNLYYYQSVGNNAPISNDGGLASGTQIINYSADFGANPFFNVIAKSNTNIGGSIQWVNGALLCDNIIM
jgi:hypothetical protein